MWADVGHCFRLDSLVNATGSGWIVVTLTSTEPLAVSIAGLGSGAVDARDKLALAGCVSSTGACSDDLALSQLQQPELAFMWTAVSCDVDLDGPLVSTSRNSSLLVLDGGAVRPGQRCSLGLRVDNRTSGRWGESPS
jgi:hypothetical protein